MTHQEMLQLLSDGWSDLDLAILKWQDMWWEWGYDDRYRNCACCYMAKIVQAQHEARKDYLGSACDFCVVKRYTRYDECRDTPYRKYHDSSLTPQERKHAKLEEMRFLMRVKDWVSKRQRLRHRPYYGLPVHHIWIEESGSIPPDVFDSLCNPLKGVGGHFLE